MISRQTASDLLEKHEEFLNELQSTIEGSMQHLLRCDEQMEV